MTPIETLLVEVQDALTGLATFWHDLLERKRSRPTKRSQASRDWGSEFGVSIHTAYSSASLFLESSAEYLECLGRVLVQPLPQKGILFLCRGVVENGARSWWLLPPGSGGSVRERARRGLLERLHDVQELIAFTVATEDPDAERDLQNLKSRRDGMFDDGRRFGFEVRTKRPFTVDGLARPTATKLMREINGVDGVLLYKFLSGSVHGTTYALLQGMDVEGATERWEGGLLVGPDDRLSPIDWVVAATVDLYCEALDRYLRAMGWPLVRWARRKQEIMVTMRRLLEAGGSAPRRLLR
ncbi:MAG TPA: hypothetical protein VHN37_00560 [Actinomycetota bacterium]|nr:hypothetical protein [Actinomycetota bacterium]